MRKAEQSPGLFRLSHCKLDRIIWILSVFRHQYGIVFHRSISGVGDPAFYDDSCSGKGKVIISAGLFSDFPINSVRGDRQKEIIILGADVGGRGGIDEIAV